MKVPLIEAIRDLRQSFLQQGLDGEITIWLNPVAFKSLVAESFMQPGIGPVDANMRSFRVCGVRVELLVGDV